ncbi:hypothetical protein BGZ54_009855 [Gamsiella multidivaricata]|nr:hypothetical protein BGZ54_009855 [Gamsiella multidivaricata]
MERDSAANPKIQLQKSRDLIDDMHLDMQMEQTTLLRLSSDHSQQLNDLITENQRLRVELALSQGETKSQSVHADMLIQIQHLQQALQQAQNVHRRYQAAGPIEPEQLSDTLAENENLQQNPQPTQQQPKEHVPESIPLSITSDRETHFAEQLAREAELLRRQLKGQRVEMKELQYTVRRSEAEKRDLVSRIEYLERSLADAEKHRNELKSHQAMKDEAYKVIQERLVASFDEEKAQYMDEETFKLVKLEHRFNLLQDELQAVRAEQDKNDRGATQTTLRQSTIDEQLEGCQSVVALQEHVAQLETELAAAAALEASLRAQVVSLQVEAKEARTNEQDVRWTVASSEECMESMRRELTANVMFHSHRLVEMDAGAVDQSTTLASLASEPGRSLEQEAEFKRELEITSQAINKDILVSGSENSEQNNILQQIEYSRLAERASQWREDCLEAQEEKMRVEDQLQRVNMEFMAAKIEIDQLEASIRAAAETPTTEWAQQDLEQEATETKKEIMRLKGELRDRDRASETLSIRVQQLEHLQSENLRLKQALETTRGVEDAAKLEVYDHGNQSLHQLLEEERKVHSEQVDGLDKQLRRAQVLLLERQAEVEKTSLELNDMIYRLSKAEGDLSIFKERQSVEQDLTGNATETATLLQTQLDDITSKYFSFMQEISEKEASLNTALSTLEREKQRAEEQVRTLTGSITAHVEQNDILQREVCTLEQDLALTTAKMRTMQQEAESSRARVTEVENQVMTLQDSYRQAEVELELIVDLFGKLLDIPDEPEEIAALENTAVSMLTEIELLGVSAPLLPRVGARLIELQKAEVNNANRIHELEAELLQLRHIKPILGPSSQDSRPREALLDGDRDRDAEVENLKRDLARAEQGISRLQQFLQEFQNEKKAALYELEQRLENSDTEVAQARAQLAKAQAMLLSRPTNPSTPTQGAFLLMPQSPTLLQDKGPFQSPRQEQPYLPKMWQDAIDVALTDKMFMGTERIHHEAILALEPLRQQKSELERTLLDLRHRYELSQKENDALLSQLEKENQQLRARTERTSPDMSSEHLERIRELEEEHLELTRQLKTAQREHEFTRQDMKVLKAELGKLKPRA